jgi:hypothetical protein
VVGATVVGAVRVESGSPARAWIVTPARPGDAGEGRAPTPVPVVLADEEGVHDAAPWPEEKEPRLGALVDVAGRRVLLGVPALLRSTFVALMYLDGRYADRFEKIDDRTGANDERVVTWRLHDPPR